MKTINRVCLIMLLLSVGPYATAAEESPRYVNVSIDRLAIDTEGLSIASGQLAKSIDKLAESIGIYRPIAKHLMRLKNSSCWKRWQVSTRPATR